MPGARKHMKEDAMKKPYYPELTPELEAEAKRLAAMPDEDIDFSDIPPLTEKFWANAVRGKFYRPVKKQVTLRLDVDILEWFKANQGGARGYQTAINAVLRKSVEEGRRKAG